MGVFHVFKIVQMVPNSAKHHIESKFGDDSQQIQLGLNLYTYVEKRNGTNFWSYSVSL